MGQSSSSETQEKSLLYPSASTSPFLKLPIDIILLVVEQLRQTPESVVVLALTCKALHKLLMPLAPTLTQPIRDSLLILLESDSSIGGQYYFCSICHTLHSFSPPWNSLDDKVRHYCHEPGYRCPCYGGYYFSPLTATYTLTYYHARLVMNRHLYGAPCGAPLSILNAANMTELFASEWRQNWSARVIENELFLCAIHTINSSGISDRALRSIIDRDCRYSICEHMNLRNHVAALQRTITKSGDGEELFSECQNSLGSCFICLTDYCTTIERNKPRKRLLPAAIWTRNQPESPSWTITIAAYHQFGSCRSPLDWKWGTTNRTYLSQLGNWRIDHPYPPGSVREKWLASQVCMA